MKRWGTIGVAFVTLLFAAGEVSAGSIKLVKGGPDKPENKRKVIQTLIGAGGKLSRCLRGYKNAVRITVSVRRNGRTRRALPDNRSRAAACVAKVIRYTRFRWTRRAWSGVIELSTATPADVARRDMSALSRDLNKARNAINGCARRYGVTGNARFRFVVAADGGLAEAKVESARGVSARARGCMVAAIQRSSVSPHPGARPVTFRLALSFANRGGYGGTGSARPNVKALQPKKFGPHTANDIGPVMRAKAAKFRRCYRRYRKPKLKGEVVMRFTIRKNGTVRNVKIRKTTLKHKRVEACIVAVGKTLKFPSAPGSTRVFYPFRFGN